MSTVPKAQEGLLAMMRAKGGIFDEGEEEAKRVTQLWQQLDTSMSEKHPRAFRMLAPSAEERAVSAWERAIHNRLPSPLRALYAAHDGAKAQSRFLSKLCHPSEPDELDIKGLE